MKSVKQLIEALSHVNPDKVVDITNMTDRFSFSDITVIDGKRVELKIDAEGGRWLTVGDLISSLSAIKDPYKTVEITCSMFKMSETNFDVSTDYDDINYLELIMDNYVE